jgi:MipA family protein
MEDPEEKAARWRVSVGAGLILGPKYPGADTYRLRALPVVGASYGAFFIGGDPGAGGGGGVGVNLVRDAAWRFGVSLAPGFGRARRESDHPSLAGMGDIDRATRATVFGGYTWRRWLSGTLRVSTDIEGEGQGTLALFDLNARWRVADRVFLSAGPGVTWADKDYTMTFFGVTADQAARSTLPAYEAESGWNAARFGIGGGYRIDQHWSLGSRLTISKLVGEAADSPITRDRTPYSAALFATYRF